MAARDRTGVHVVVSTPIRLARNLAAFPFTNRASAHQKAEIEALLNDRLPKLDLTPPLQYVSLGGFPLLDRQFLVERQLVSRELANGDGPRGVAFDERESVSMETRQASRSRSSFKVDSLISGQSPSRVPRALCSIHSEWYRPAG